MGVHSIQKHLLECQKRSSSFAMLKVKHYLVVVVIVLGILFSPLAAQAATSVGLDVFQDQAQLTIGVLGCYTTGLKNKSEGTYVLGIFNRTNKGENSKIVKGQITKGTLSFTDRADNAKRYDLSFDIPAGQFAGVTSSSMIAGYEDARSGFIYAFIAKDSSRVRLTSAQMTVSSDLRNYTVLPIIRGDNSGDPDATCIGDPDEFDKLLYKRLGKTEADKIKQRLEELKSHILALEATQTVIRPFGEVLFPGGKFRAPINLLPRNLYRPSFMK